MPQSLARLLRYAVVPFVVAAAVLLRHGLAALFGAENAFLFLWPAVLFCAWYGGLGPGLLATLLAAAAANYFHVPPLYSLAVTSLTEAVVLSLFVLLGVLVSLLSEGLQRARRRAEAQAQELARQREWLRVTLAGIDDAVVTAAADGRVTFVNPAAEALSGWGEGEAVGKPVGEVLRLISQVPWRPVEDPVAAVLRSGSPVPLGGHAALLGRDGVARAVEGAASPLREGGVLAGVVVAFRDVTERRRAEEELARLAAIVESSEDAIVSRTLDGVILTWNRGAERLYGYAAEEAVGRQVSMLVPEDRADELPAVVERLRRGERVEPYETMRRRKDGSLVDVSVSVAPLKNPAGKVVGVAVIARRRAGRGPHDTPPGGR